MARWISTITNAGLALLARTPNNSFVFTKAECGSGMVDTSLLEAQIAVTDFKKALLISSCTNTNNQVKLRVQLNNENIATGFSLHQVGIYAKLSTDSADILFMLIQTDLADFIPSVTESPNYVCDYVVNTVISNAASISANVDPAGYVTQGQLEEILAGLEDVELKNNVTQIKQDIGATADTGGGETCGTIFAKLNKIIHDILEMITNIGNTADAGGTETTGTLMGKTNALLKGVGGKITSGNKKYSPIVQEQLIMIDKSPILGNNTNTNDLLKTQGYLVVGDNFIYTYQRYSTSSYRLISLSLANNKIRTVANGVQFSNSLSLKKCKNDTHIFYPYSSSYVYKVDHRTDDANTAFNSTGVTIASMVATNEVVYIYDKTSHKIMAYSATVANTKLRESAVIGTSEGEGDSLFLLNSQNLSLLATLSSSNIHDVFSYGEDFLCTSQVGGYTSILKINKTTPSASVVESSADLRYFAIEDLDYLSDGSIMFYSSDDRVNGAIHLIVSTSGEITRLSDNHDYINLRFGPMCIDKNTDCIYKIITSFRDIDPGPYAGVMYIGKFIKKHVIVGYDLEV